MSWIKPALCVALIVGLPLGCSAVRHSINASYMIGYVPKKLGLTKEYSEGACINDMFGYMGAFAVGLDSESVRQIEENGIHYFDDIGGPRSKGHGVHFGDWKETPALEIAFSMEPPGHYSCGQLHGSSWPSGVIEALSSPGSFYSDNLQGRSAVVIPSLGIIAISMETR
jgi:hypothetical protein